LGVWQMTRASKVHYFESEGRENLPAVIKSIKAYLKGLDSQNLVAPQKIVFLTLQGEGPMLAYNQLQSENLEFVAVTFPAHYGTTRPDGTMFVPEIPDKVRQFFHGVGIPIITQRFPLDNIAGCEAHNREMSLIRDTLIMFGGSFPLAVQAVLQATDSGLLKVGEQVLVATGDTALLVTASTTEFFLRKDHLGFAVNEVLCKPSVFTRSRPLPAPKKSPSLGAGTGTYIEGKQIDPVFKE
jgi:hypothetical protein